MPKRDSAQEQGAWALFDWEDTAADKNILVQPRNKIAAIEASTGGTLAGGTLISGTFVGPRSAVVTLFDGTLVGETLFSGTCSGDLGRELGWGNLVRRDPGLGGNLGWRKLAQRDLVWWSLVAGTLFGDALVGWFLFVCLCSLVRFFGDILWDLGIWFGGTFVGEGLEALVRWDLFRGALFGRTLSGTFLGGYCWRRALVGGTLSGGPCLEGPCSAGFFEGARALVW